MTHHGDHHYPVCASSRDVRREQVADRTTQDAKWKARGIFSCLVSLVIGLSCQS
ncbi:hypothetical protein BS78_10G198100 [Paspalum vaginatum]|nr:hypothetical protein BS78_10G198100 [Paspalum vaginatum]